jgi:hypothetical protein
VLVFGRRQRREARQTELAGVQKAPRHEVAGSWDWLGSERYGDLMLAPISMMGGMPARGHLDVCTDARSGECSRHFGARSERIQRAIGGLVDVIGSREIAAGVEPAHRNGKAARSTGGLAHDVSILIGVGRHLGSQPRANTSMTIMRALQRGHGQGSTRGLSGAISGCSWGSAAGGATLRSARAVRK